MLCASGTRFGWVIAGRLRCDGLKAENNCLTGMESRPFAQTDGSSPVRFDNVLFMPSRACRPLRLNPLERA